ncbi:MAG: hypothetical protein ABSD74_13365 [Rhizomicrobium sp.]|jgi:hypothetical protein
MHRLIGRIAATLLCTVAICAARAQDEPPPIRQFDIATTEKLGAAIFRQDQEASKATDLLFAKIHKADLDSEKIHGWIVEPAASGDVVRFVRDGANGPEGAYDVAFAGGDAAGPDVPKDRTLTSGELAQFNARALALKNAEHSCTGSYNTVALADPQSNGWLVWTLAATTDASVIQVGGHTRFTISADGRQIVSRDALSRSCFAVNKKTDHGQPAAAFFSQPVSDVPVETAVWLNFLHKTPLYVITRDGNLWKIDNGAITAMKR